MHGFTLVAAILLSVSFVADVTVAQELTSNLEVAVGIAGSTRAGDIPMDISGSIEPGNMPVGFSGSTQPGGASGGIADLTLPDATAAHHLAMEADSLTFSPIESDSAAPNAYKKALKAARVDPGIVWFPQPELDPKIQWIKPPKNVDPKMIIPRKKGRDGSDRSTGQEIRDE